MPRPRMLNETVKLDDSALAGLAEAAATIEHLTAVQTRLAEGGALWTHLERAKEAVWAATYPGSVDDSILNALEISADQAE